MIPIIPIQPQELNALKDFFSTQEGIPEILRRAVLIKIHELRDIGEINTDELSTDIIGQQTLAMKLAHDKLVEVFDALGLGASEELLTNRETRESFR